MPQPDAMSPGAGSTVLLVVDVQERFRPAISGFDAVVAGCARLVRAFRILGLPILVTEQYPRGLGKTVPEVADALGLDRPGQGPVDGRPSGEGGSPGGGGPPVFEKTAFSACGAPGILERLPAGRRLTVVVCGIETHVCVNQSVRDLLETGHAVEVCVDAVGSRKESDREVALRKMESSGAVLTTTEMVAFELLGDARHPKFKEVQALFK